MREQILVALVRFLRRSKARELPHRPELAAITGSMNATCIGRLSGISKVFLLGPVLGKIGARIEPPHPHSRDCGEAGMAVRVEVYARGCANRFFRSLFERWSQDLLGPCQLRGGGMTSGKYFVDGRVGNRLHSIRAHGSCCFLTFGQNTQ